LSRYLAIDWDHGQLRVAELEVRGRAADVTNAACWDGEPTPNLADPEGAGKTLKERMKEVGIGPAPVIFCVGRDRLILRDIRYPEAPPAEVPAIIRFQATKELAFPAEEARIDYHLCPVPWPGGEKRALVAILRNEMMQTYEQVCQAAGLKLSAICPGSFGIAANAKFSGQAVEPTAVLVRSPGRDELCVVQDGELLFSRVLKDNVAAHVNGSANGATANGVGSLVPEIRRSLAAYAGVFPQQTVRGFSIAGDLPAEEQSNLSASLRMPVNSYDPLGGAKPSGLNGHPRSVFAAAVGAVQASSHLRRLPVDFLAVKEPPPPANPTRKYGFYVAALLAALLLGSIAVQMLMLQPEESRLSGMRTEVKRLDGELAALSDVDKIHQSVRAWFADETVMMDQIYDIIARYPDEVGIRITKLHWKPMEKQRAGGLVPAKPVVAAKPLTGGGSNLRQVGTLELEATSTSPMSLERLMRGLRENGSWRVESSNKKVDDPNTIEAKLHVYGLRPSEYKTLLGTHRNQTAGVVAPVKPDKSKPTTKPATKPSETKAATKPADTKPAETKPVEPPPPPADIEIREWYVADEVIGVKIPDAEKARGNTMVYLKVRLRRGVIADKQMVNEDTFNVILLRQFTLIADGDPASAHKLEGPGESEVIIKDAKAEYFDQGVCFVVPKAAADAGKLRLIYATQDAVALESAQKKIAPVVGKPPVKPTDTKPATTKPAETKPATTKPSEIKHPDPPIPIGPAAIGKPKRKLDW
jgi:hypothetical protein